VRREGDLRRQRVVRVAAEVDAAERAQRDTDRPGARNQRLERRDLGIESASSCAPPSTSSALHGVATTSRMNAQLEAVIAHRGNTASFAPRSREIAARASRRSMVIDGPRPARTAISTGRGRGTDGRSHRLTASRGEPVAWRAIGSRPPSRR
jgi:hypothetical protein